MRSLLQNLNKHRWLFIIAILVFALDQLSKGWIAHSLPSDAYYGSEGAICVIPEWFYIVHVYNPGAAWGMFSGYAMALALLGIAALVLVFVFRRQLELERPGIQAIFGLMCGGIAGNLVDRIHFGHVLDFILVILPGGYHWPAFNVADIAITTSVILYCLLSLWQSASQRPPKTPHQS